MKRSQLLLLSILAIGLPGGAGLVRAETYPADAEARYDLPALETYADRHARRGDQTEVWGVGRRQVQPHDAFPFGGGHIDD
jgi:hypothetical protein